MIHKFINSKELIEKIYDEYNIQSDDFITRFPNWAFNVLRSIKIKQVYLLENVMIDIVNYKAFIPHHVDKIYMVGINGYKGNPIFGDFLKDKIKYGSNSMMIGIDGTVLPDKNNVIELLTKSCNNTTSSEDLVFGIRSYKYDNSKSYDYKINNGWVHTYIETGTCELICGSIPYEYDEQTDLIFPLIPDDADLKEAITNYCLMNLLRRGLKHHTLSLVSNNRFTNPALAYEYYIPKARNSCNSLSTQAKENLSKILNINLM